MSTLVTTTDYKRASLRVSLRASLRTRAQRRREHPRKKRRDQVSILLYSHCVRMRDLDNSETTHYTHLRSTLITPSWM